VRDFLNYYFVLIGCLGFYHDLKQKLDDAQKEKMLAVTDAAKSKLQLEGADLDNQEMKEQIKTLQARIEGLTEEKYEAEKKLPWQRQSLNS
jgi:small-conductance mechanosensitive channel